jgi:hypothetical protein
VKSSTNLDELVKNRKPPLSVIPANPGSRSGTGAGIQKYQGLLDPVSQRGDEVGDLLRSRQPWADCKCILS